MKVETYYVCEKCGKKFLTPEGANGCENSHGVPETVFVPSGYDFSVAEDKRLHVPMFVVVRMHNGKCYSYKAVSYMPEYDKKKEKFFVDLML